MKIKYLAIILLLISTAIGCKKFLDVKPKGIIIPHTVLDYDKMMNGVVSNLVCSYLPYLDPDNGVPDQIAVSTGTTAYRAFGWEPFISTQDDQDNDWNRLYKSIYTANEIINNIKEAPGTDEKLRQEVKADALAERAICYFMLVNSYSKHYNSQTASTDLGVPLLLENNLEQSKERATVQEVYKQILDDLNTALVNVRNGFPVTKVRTSKVGVYGLLARVHLFIGDFEKAKLYADSSIAIYNQLIDYNEPAQPNTPTPTQFDDNPEIIWYKDTYNFNTFKRFYYSEDLSSIFDRDNDLRWIYYAKDSTDAGVPILQGPYERPSKTVNDRGMIINTPVVLLIRSEARIRKGDIVGGIEDLNTLRKKRFTTNTPLLVASDFNENSALLEVVNERRRELCFSGYNWFSLKRYAVQGPGIPTFQRVYKGETITLAPGSPRYVLAIPPNVMNLNSKLIQNER